MKIIKRSGEEQEFDIEKIVSAISRANLEVDKKDRLSDEKIREIATEVEKTCFASFCVNIITQKRRESA